jgi:hypothetical protein
MDGISRSRSQSTFENHAIEIDDSMLDATTGAVGAGLGGADKSDDRRDGLLSGDSGLARVYDAVDALDRRTTDLGSDTELAVYGPASRAAIGPAPISAAQGRHLAASARQMLAEEPRRTPWPVAPIRFNGSRT